MEQNKPSKIWRDYLVAILGAAAFALFIRTTVMEAYRIPSPLMKPTLEPGDVIFVSKWPYFFEGRIPKRGSVIVFSAPGVAGIDAARRVIGQPGETVEIKDGRILINGTPLLITKGDQDSCGVETLTDGQTHPVCFDSLPLENRQAEKIPSDSVFVVGDYRKGSGVSDSVLNTNRNDYIVSTQLIKANALWVWISIDPERSQVRWNRFFKKIK